jgi:hypothetical protein
MADKHFKTCNVPEGVDYVSEMTDKSGRSLADGGDPSKAALAYVQLNKKNEDGSYLFYTPEIKKDGMAINGSKLDKDGKREFVFRIGEGVTSGVDYDHARQVLRDLGVTCTGDKGPETFDRAGVPLPNALDLLHATRNKAPVKS